jgi:hypothetical protein
VGARRRGRRPGTMAWATGTLGCSGRAERQERARARWSRASWSNGMQPAAAFAAGGQRRGGGGGTDGAPAEDVHAGIVQTFTS